MPRGPAGQIEARRLRALRRRRRRLSSACFLAAGIGFGTAFYLLRTRFLTLHAPAKGIAFLALLAATILLFYAGAHAESEIHRLDEELRELEGS